MDDGIWVSPPSLDVRGCNLYKSTGRIEPQVLVVVDNETIDPVARKSVFFAQALNVPRAEHHKSVVRCGHHCPIGSNIDLIGPRGGLQLQGRRTRNTVAEKRQLTCDRAQPNSALWIGRNRLGLRNLRLGELLAHLEI